MTRGQRQIVLASIAALMWVLLIAFVMNREVALDPVRPADLDALARHLADHPADWLAASAIADQALDSNVSQRRDLWRASYEHAARLAPNRRNTAAAFVRSGLFNWYELDDADRSEILRAAAPLLRDPSIFFKLSGPLWELTHDMAYLRRNAPQHEEALIGLRTISATHGLFDHYRALREEVVRFRLRDFEARRARLAPPDLLHLLPRRLDRSYEALARGVLAELERRPLDASNAAIVQDRADDLIAFAIRHDLKPLDGLDALVGSKSIAPVTRARLAVALGRAKDATSIELGFALAGAEEWVPYYHERAQLEAARGHQEMAAAYLHNASLAGIDDPYLVAARRVALLGGDQVAASSYTAQLAARAKRPRVWSGMTTNEFGAGSIRIDVSVEQTDEVPPYVEIFVDDARVAEGPVQHERRFEIPLRTADLHHIEVRLANPLTRNRDQRRVRLS